MSKRRGAVILAGGRSERMGRDKAWQPVAGVPAVAFVAGIAARVCDRVVVVGTPGRALPELPDGVARVDDPTGVAEQGPLRAIETGLSQLPDDALAYLGACDAIGLTEAHVAFVLDRLAATPNVDACLPRADGHVHPLAAAVRVAAARAAATAALAAGHRAATRLFDLLVTELVDDLPDPHALADANTPQQWAAARERR